ncbi:MAG: serine recombinase [Hyphomicrobium sp. 32-62-53]|nr:MAG: serine recombinase [Hyphomicrobium sp. 12-62-95]OYX97084.1 MAG: serine recombinase [Hyphomicrobium sp. 32-62-53]
MTTNDALLPATLLQRKAVVYVRQSTPQQVQSNLESQRRQYELVEVARRRGFTNVEVIDDDLGRSASGTVARPGFDRLVAALCAGQVGAVLCLDASRLARNGRDWHHLLELCGLVEARVIDLDGVYDPCRPNDRLLLGMKGSISEFELGVIRSRMYEAARSKARRGELRLPVPIGYSWDRHVGLTLDPDRRLQEVIHLVFSKFRELGSARQVLLWMAAEGIHFPYPTDGRTLTSFEWRLIRYRNIIAILKNPFYAGVYTYGKSEKRTEIVDGRARKSYGHRKPMDAWEVFIKDHHEGYIGWAEYERNQAVLAGNAYGKVGDTKSGRGGRALLAGLICCGRCGRKLKVTYNGRYPRPVYGCESPNLQLGHKRCFRMGGKHIDETIAAEMLHAVTPIAIEASKEAERMLRDEALDRQRIAEMELSQARYDAALTERRYAACDPDNRLIAAQLEKAWEGALQRVEACRQRLDAMRTAHASVAQPDFASLAVDLSTAWKAPTTTMRTRQRLVRALITEIIADVDPVAGEIVLVIHWKGGQHSELRVKKPKTGEHGCTTPEQALAVMRSMAGRWSDEHIAASLNRMGLPTGQGKTWTAHRVGSIRRVNGIHGYLSAEKNGDWLTMRDAAAKLGVSHHQVRKLIKAGVLASKQIIPDAPHQIRAADLANEQVVAALKRKGRPCRATPENQLSIFSDTYKGGAE